MVTDPPEKADVIFPLSGQTLWRGPKAAQLFQEGYAQRVIVTGKGESDYLLLLLGVRMMDTEVASRLLQRFGIPEEAMVLLNGETSTYEEALLFRDYIRTHPVKSAILVTSHLHSRRARWTFEKMLREEGVKLFVVEAEQPHFPVHRWWQHEDGLITVVNEYLKFAFYLLHY
jgi:uncharacterized SAM-binding protein YcdF (DUF218 family)